MQKEMKVALDWDHPDPFTLDITVKAADVDALKHTNNAVYVTGWIS